MPKNSHNKILLLALTIVATTGAQASATTVPPGEGPPTVWNVSYTSSGGESNHLSVELAFPNTGQQLTISDSNAPVVAPTGCTNRDVHTFTCLAPPAAFDGPVRLNLTLDASDQDDTVTVSDPEGSWPAFRINGGPGNDTLNGGPEPDLFNGGPGNDTISGGGGADKLKGGGDTDVIHGDSGEDILDDGDGEDGARINADRLDGGSDTDLVAYASRKESINVDLSANVPILAGQSGENDELTGIEGAEGGSANDRLIAQSVIDGGALNGNAGADTIIGGSRGDTIKGGSGDDQLTGNDGNDFIEGNDDSDKISGDGGDDLLAGDHGNDSVDGGTGNDQLHDANDRASGGAVTGNDALTGGEGNDNIRSNNAQNAVISGGTGSDQISAGDIAASGKVDLQAGDGNDIIFLEEDSPNSLRFSCGAGVDTAHYRDWRAPWATLPLARDCEHVGVDSGPIGNTFTYEPAFGTRRAMRGKLITTPLPALSSRTLLFRFPCPVLGRSDKLTLVLSAWRGNKISTRRIVASAPITRPPLCGDGVRVKLPLTKALRKAVAPSDIVLQVGFKTRFGDTKKIGFASYAVKLHE